MPYSPRSVRVTANKTKRKFWLTIIFITILLYVSATWILPTFISLIGDMVKPTIQETSIADIATLAPPVLEIPHEATNTAQINIKGYATGSTVKIYLDDSLIKSAEVDEKGNFLAEDISLFLGTNNLYGKTEDEKGRESLPSKLIKLIYDNQKPILELYEPEDKTVNQDRIKFAGRTEEGASVYINHSKTIINEEGKFSNEIVLTEGENKIAVKAVDFAGNATEIERVITYKKD